MECIVTWWTTILLRVGIEAQTTYLILWMGYNTEPGLYERHMVQDELKLSNKQETPITSMCPIGFGSTGIRESAQGRDTEHVRAKSRLV